MANEKLFPIKRKYYIKMLPIASDPKKSVAKAMLNKKVDILYHLKVKNIVKDMKLTS